MTTDTEATWADVLKAIHAATGADLSALDGTTVTQTGPHETNPAERRQRSWCPCAMTHCRCGRTICAICGAIH